MFWISDAGARLRSNAPASAAFSYWVEAWTVTDCDGFWNVMPWPVSERIGVADFLVDLGVADGGLGVVDIDEDLDVAAERLQVLVLGA